MALAWWRMGGSTTALVVALVGVLGTLLSGLLVQQGALRAKRVELAHLEREHAQERAERVAATERETRRASCVALNQRARVHHRALGAWHDARAAGSPEDDARQLAVEEAHDQLNAAYAEAQLAVSDEVLAAAGRLVHLLFGPGTASPSKG